MSINTTYLPDTRMNLAEIRALLFERKELHLSAEALDKVANCYTFLKDFSADKIIYGINTGFGPMAQYRIEDDSLKQLQYNIIRSHSTGAGNPLPPLYVKSAMIARLNTIGAQIALLTGNHSYNNTYVHRGFSFESALLDAALLLQEGEASTVLAGAVDEMTPALHAILGRMGCWEKAPPGEGVTFFLLSGKLAADSRVAIQDMEMFSGTYPDSEIDRRMEEQGFVGPFCPTIQFVLRKSFVYPFKTRIRDDMVYGFGSCCNSWYWCIPYLCIFQH